MLIYLSLFRSTLLPGVLFSALLIILLHGSGIAQENTGTIKGKVFYKGGEVHKTKNVIKDEKTCGSGDIIDKSLLAGENGGLKWAVVSIASEIKGKKSFEELPGKPVLDQSGCVFKPHIVVVAVDKPLIVTNSDKTLHNVRTVSMFNESVNTAQIYMPGKSQPRDTFYFSEPEIIKTVCDVHGWMKSYIHVVDHAYYDVTGENGSFRITDVPPGKYTLKVWHETLGEKKKTIQVKSGETAELKFRYQATQPVSKP